MAKGKEKKVFSEHLKRNKGKYIAGAAVGLGLLATSCEKQSKEPADAQTTTLQEPVTETLSLPIIQYTEKTKEVPKDILYVVQKGDKLWNIVKEHYPDLKSDKEISDKVNEVALLNAERGLKHLLIDNRAIDTDCNNILEQADKTLGDLIYAKDNGEGDKLLLPGVMTETTVTEETEVGVKKVTISNGDTTYHFEIYDASALDSLDFLKDKTLELKSVTSRTDTTTVPQFCYPTRTDTSEVYVAVKEGDRLEILTKDMYKGLSKDEVPDKVNEVALFNAEKEEKAGKAPKGKSHYRTDNRAIQQECNNILEQADGIMGDLIYAGQDTIAFRVTQSVTDTVKTGDTLFVKTYADSTYIMLPDGDVLTIKGNVPTDIDTLVIPYITKTTEPDSDSVAIPTLPINLTPQDNTGTDTCNKALSLDQNLLDQYRSDILKRKLLKIS